jgi:hypothetical protein
MQCPFRTLLDFTKRIENYRRKSSEKSKADLPLPFDPFLWLFFFDNGLSQRVVYVHNVVDLSINNSRPHHHPTTLPFKLLINPSQLTFKLTRVPFYQLTIAYSPKKGGRSIRERRFLGLNIIAKRFIFTERKCLYGYSTQSGHPFQSESGQSIQ